MSPKRTEKNPCPDAGSLAFGLESVGDLRIGEVSPAAPFVLAPLAGVGDWPFRLLALNLGAGLAYTEMISSEGLVRKGSGTLRMLHRPEGERLFAPQIFGSDPTRMGEAAAAVEGLGASLVDINMGCPVKKVCKSGAGAALMKDPSRVEAIVRSVVSRVSIPVQVKIRTGWDAHAINALEIARIAEESGALAITVHGRTRAQGYRGMADWEIIGEVKKRARRAVVIGNGDVFSARQAVERLKEYELDGVMIGRGSLGNPWIFRDARALLAAEPLPPPPTTEEWREAIACHLQDLISYRDGDEARAVRQFRSHLVWYTRGRKGSSAFRAELPRILSRQNVFDCLERHFPAGQEEELDRESLIPDTKDLERAWS